MKKHDKGCYALIVFFAVFLAIGTLAWAQETDFDEVSYESLVSELTRVSASTPEPTPSAFDQVRIHAGIALVNALANISAAEEQFSSTNSGLQLSQGIDLFSPYWIAEGSLRTFDDYMDDEHTVTLKEFDLKFLHSMPFSSYNLYGGLGLSARYLYVYHRESKMQTDYSTPASIAFLGVNTELTKSVSFGAELSRRATMITDTPDKTAYDFSLRMNAHF